ncbi:hypothetical protein AALA99_14515 [Anaerotruncus colihominis]|uniref:hypothetical protein n=1 Tax=Anaerotruncus colihominis TaxID=169435 RepID=UPI003511F938
MPQSVITSDDCILSPAMDYEVKYNCKVRYFPDNQIKITCFSKKTLSDLLSNGRHAIIHLVLATQNPVKEYMKGSIANISARIALKCSHYQNSIAILGRAEAEKLIGKGQMIFDATSEQDK